MKYLAVYKYPLCNGLSQHGEPKEIPYEELPTIIAKVIKNQMFAGNQYLYQAPMHMIHQCKNGNCGVAVFAGFIKA